MNYRFGIVLVVIVAVLVMIFLAAHLTREAVQMEEDVMMDDSNANTEDVLRRLMADEEGVTPVDIDAAFEDFDAMLDDLDS